MIAEPDDDGHVQSVVAERGPTVLRIALGGQLRKLREKRNITREAAGDAMRGSPAKISRRELGRSGVKERDNPDQRTHNGTHYAFCAPV
uniref:helix-turn-helix domain-containing protein n=1 Tax=Nocardia abscessus TaxID=120957 RepID=UPI0024559852